MINNHRRISSASCNHIMLKNFGLEVAKIRQSKNLSQYELSLRLGRDPTYIHKVENGKVNISLKALFELCEVLEINPKELF